MPLETMASAMDLIISSLTLQANLFQLFQPMGGVRATPLSQARAAGTRRKVRARKINALRNFAMFIATSGNRGEIIQEFAKRFVSRRLNLLFRGAVEDDANFFEGDEAAADHFVETRKNGFDFFCSLDDFDDDGQILRETEDFVGVIRACAAVAADSAEDGCAGEAFATQEFDDGFVQGFAMPFVGFADMDAHQSAFAFEFLVSHGG